MSYLPSSSTSQRATSSRMIMTASSSILTSSSSSSPSSSNGESPYRLKRTISTFSIPTLQSLQAQSPKVSFTAAAPTRPSSAIIGSGHKESPRTRRAPSPEGKRVFGQTATSNTRPPMRTTSLVRTGSRRDLITFQASSSRNASFASSSTSTSTASSDSDSDSEDEEDSDFTPLSSVTSLSPSPSSSSLNNQKAAKKTTTTRSKGMFFIPSSSDCEESSEPEHDHDNHPRRRHRSRAIRAPTVDKFSTTLRERRQGALFPLNEEPREEIDALVAKFGSSEDSGALLTMMMDEEELARLTCEADATPSSRSRSSSSSSNTSVRSSLRSAASSSTSSCSSSRALEASPLAEDELHPLARPSATPTVMVSDEEVSSAPIVPVARRARSSSIASNASSSSSSSSSSSILSFSFSSLQSLLQRPSPSTQTSPSSSSSSSTTTEKEMSTYLIRRSSSPSTSSSNLLPLTPPLSASSSSLPKLRPTRFRTPWQHLSRTPVERATLAPRGAARARMGARVIKDCGEFGYSRSTSRCGSIIPGGVFSASRNAESFLPGPEDFFDLDEENEDEAGVDDEEEDYGDDDDDDEEEDSDDDLDDIFLHFSSRSSSSPTTPKKIKLYHRTRAAANPLYHLVTALENTTALMNHLPPPRSASSHYHSSSSSSRSAMMMMCGEGVVPWRSELHRIKLLDARRYGGASEVIKPGVERLCERGRWVVLSSLSSSSVKEDERRRVRVGSSLRNVAFGAGSLLGDNDEF